MNKYIAPKPAKKVLKIRGIFQFQSTSIYRRSMQWAE